MRITASLALYLLALTTCFSTYMLLRFQPSLVRSAAYNTLAAGDRLGEPRRRRLIVALTARPSRLSRLRPLLDSLVRQTRRPAAILICIPWLARGPTDKKPYFLPQWLSRRNNVWQARVVRTERDWGSIGHLLGALSVEPDAGTRIVLLDGDRADALPSHVLQSMEQAAMCSPDLQGGCRHASGTEGANVTGSGTVLGLKFSSGANSGSGSGSGSGSSGGAGVRWGGGGSGGIPADILRGATLVQRGWFDYSTLAAIARRDAGPGTPLFCAEGALLCGFLESQRIARVVAAAASVPALGGAAEDTKPCSYHTAVVHAAQQLGLPWRANALGGGKNFT